MVLVGKKSFQRQLFCPAINSLAVPRLQLLSKASNPNFDAKLPPIALNRHSVFLGISVCRKLENPWHSFLRNLYFCHPYRDIWANPSPKS